MKYMDALRNSDGGKINRISLKKKESFKLNELKNVKNLDLSPLTSPTSTNSKMMLLKSLKCPELVHISKNIPTERLMEEN